MGDLCTRATAASPDEDALAVVPLPQAAVALAGHGENVRRQLPHLVPAVQLHRRAVVQAADLLVGVDGGQDGADVGLSPRFKQREEIKRHI